MRVSTICYLIDTKNNKILLGRKKYGVAKGVLNGFGGKVEKTDKSIKEAAIREIFEETSVTIVDPNLSGIIHFHYKDPNNNAYVYIYLCEKWNGEPKESKEMEQSWFDIDGIPINEMWPDDKIWFPTFLEKGNISVRSFRNKPGEFPYKTLIEIGKEIFEGMHKQVVDPV